MKLENNLQQQSIYNQQKLNSNQKQECIIKSFAPTASPDEFKSFKGAATGGVKLNIFERFLNFLSTDMAWGAVLIDLVSMVIPRTLIDFFRSPKAGAETGVREGAGTFNHSMIGVYGALAGLLFAQGLNKDFGVKANRIYADNLTVDTYKNILVDQAKSTGKTNEKDFVMSALKSYDSSKQKNNEVLEDLTNSLVKAIKEEKIDKNVKSDIKTNLIKYFQSEDAIFLKNGEKVVNYSVDNILDNIVSIGKTMQSKKLDTADKFETFFNALKKMNLRRSVLGIAIGALVGMSVQPLNVYITKKRTGTSGFVGGGEEDKSFGFKVKKTLAALGFAAGALASIGKLKDLAKNIQFQGTTPTIPQFKFIYGMTIFSRFLAARNGNELREGLFKDTLGFVNWLILGSFVQKGVAKALDKDLVVGKNIINSKLVTRNEILLSDMADNLKKAKLKKLNIAQLSGYLYSILALGICVPKLNIWLTNKLSKKNEQKQQEKSQQITQTKPEKELVATNTIFAPDKKIVKDFYTPNTINNFKLNATRAN